MNRINLYSNDINTGTPQQNIVEYFRHISYWHKEVKVFTTGLSYMEEGLEGNTMPLVFVQFPFPSTLDFDTEGNSRLRMEVTVSVYNAGIILQDSVENNISPEMINTVYNQNEVEGLVLYDAIEARSFRIAGEIITRFNRDLSNNHRLLLGAELEGSVIINSERNVTSSEVCKTTMTFTLVMNNPFRCTLYEVFNCI